MKYDYSWFRENFDHLLKHYQVEETEYEATQFGPAKTIEFEIPEKIVGFITLYVGGVLHIEILDQNHDDLLNIFIVKQDENTDNEKDAAFQEFKEVLSKYINPTPNSL